MKKTVNPGETPSTWDAEALFAKSQRYAEQMAAKDSTSWEHALLSALCLEILARAALANVHPALLADARDRNWNSLLHSLGFTPTESKFSPRSIPTNEVIRRLGEILYGFDKEDESFCQIHVGARNAELHSGETPFDGVQPSTWQPAFFKACKALLASLGLELADLFGNEEANTAEKLIAAASDERAQAAKGDVANHAKFWEEKSDEERKSLSESARVWSTRQAGHRVSCPACASQALLYGEPINAPVQSLEDELIVERQEYLPSQFECIACELKISGFSRLSAVGLGDRFTHTQFYDPAEFYAPEDQYYGYEEDNNERF